MSHVAEFKTQFRSVEALEKALVNLGWEIRYDGKINTYPSDPKRNVVYEKYAANPTKGGYDIGLVESKEGEINIIYDPYGGSVEKSLGSGLSELKKNYVLKLMEEEFETVEILETLADGSIVVEGDDGL